jgi:pilus assembly protein CpaE
MNKALSMSDHRYEDEFGLDDDLDFPASDDFLTETPDPNARPAQQAAPQVAPPAAPQAPHPAQSQQPFHSQQAYQQPQAPQAPQQTAPQQPAHPPQQTPQAAYPQAVSQPVHPQQHQPQAPQQQYAPQTPQQPAPQQQYAPQAPQQPSAPQHQAYEPYQPQQQAQSVHPAQQQLFEQAPPVPTPAPYPTQAAPAAAVAAARAAPPPQLEDDDDLDMAPQMASLPPRAQPQEVTGGGSLQFTGAEAFNPVGQMIAHAEAAMVEVNVPRIGIHIFAERPDTAESAHQASQDRRMNRATTMVRLGGVQSALETYSAEPTPALIIVESLAPAAQLIHALDMLAECCDGDTKVVVIGSSNDITLYRELMRRGVSEYMVAPIAPLQLIAAIGNLFNDPAAPFVGRTIAFIGARGGVGSSTVAHNTAYALSERMASETVIVDFDLPFGTAGLNFNQDPLTGIADALSQPERLDGVLLDRMMTRCTERLSLFAAPATLDNDWDVSPEVIEEVAQKIRGTAPYVVLDLPNQWNAWVRRMMISADEVVIVATPDLASLRNAKNMLDLAKAARPNDAPPRLVLNQMGVPGRPEIPLKDFTNALGAAPALVLPFDAKIFGTAANNGQMVLDTAGKSKAADGFHYLAQIVAKREMLALPAPKDDKKSILGGLFKKKR